jgi:TonB-dependent Receptor Plug Domain
MSTARKLLVPLLASAAMAALAGCWDPRVRTAHESPAPRSRGISAYVFDEDQLQSSSDGTLLAALEARMSSMGVLRGGECPQIVLRGRTTVARPSNPGVYVDGARATNTCVLETLNVSDVHRVEIYPMGIAQRGAYEAQAGGLILVFMRTGS